MPGGPPSIRRVLWAAFAALLVGLGAVGLLQGFSTSFPLRLLEGIGVFAGGALLLGGVVTLVTWHLADWRSPASEAEFERIVERSERLAREGSWGEGDEDWEYEDYDEELDLSDEENFKALVRSALDDLPLEFHRALEHVAVVVSQGGRRRRAYGLYEGDTVARDHFHERIVIFQDTLLRDFGHDPDLLKRQVTRTVRHELAHHLGWDERGVRGLGL